MTTTFAPPRIESEQRPDGGLLIRSAEPLAEHPVSIVHSFRAGSEAHPGRLLVAERSGEEWARLTWGEARARVDALAQGLLDRELADRPVMVLSGNSRLHLVVALAAMTVGVPLVPTSVAYSLQSTDHAKLRAMAELVDPGLVVAEDASFAGAVAAVAAGRTVLSPDASLRGALHPDDLAATPTAEVDRRCAALDRGDVAKILFTSGSTGAPKGSAQHPRHAVGQPAADPPGLAVPRRRTAGAARLAALEPHVRRQPRHEHGAHQRRHPLDR